MPAPLPVAGPIERVPAARPQSRDRARLPSAAGWALIGILLGATLIRLWAISRQDIWHDEALSLLAARLPFSDLTAFTAGDVHPPLYYLLLKAWLVPAGAAGSVGWARLLGVIVSWPAVPLALALARRWHGMRAGLIAGTLLAVAPLAVFYAVEIRMYGLLLTLSLATVLAYDSLSRGQQHAWLWTAALAGLGAALLYTAYAGGLLLIVLGIDWLAGLDRRPRTLNRRYLVALAGCFVLYLPWIGVLIGQIARVGTTYWIAPPLPLAPLFSYLQFAIGYSLPAAGQAVGLFVVTALLALAVGAAWRRVWAGAGGDRLLLLWLVLPPGLIWALSLARPLYLDRVVLVSAPALYLLLAAFIAQRWRDWPVRILTSGLGVLTVASLIGFGYAPEFQKAPMGEASRWLAERWQPGDVVVHTSTGSRLPFGVYLPDLPQSLAPDDPAEAIKNAPSQGAERLAGAPQPIAEATAGAERLWLVVALDHSVEHQRELLRQARERYPLLDETSIGGIGIYLFDLVSSR